MINFVLHGPGIPEAAVRSGFGRLSVTPSPAAGGAVNGGWHALALNAWCPGW